MATATAPPTMAATSRAMPVVNAAAPVCRPGFAVLVAEPFPVASGVMTVMEVIVLRLPSDMVVVLLKVEVLKLVGSVEAEVEWLDFELEVLVVVDRVEGALVVDGLVVSLVEDTEVGVGSAVV